MKTFNDQAVAAVFAAYPDIVWQKLMFLRQLIFDTALEITEVGEIEETLKWGEHCGLTSLQNPKQEALSGSTGCGKHLISMRYIFIVKQAWSIPSRRSTVKPSAMKATGPSYSI